MTTQQKERHLKMAKLIIRTGTAVTFAYSKQRKLTSVPSVLKTKSSIPFAIIPIVGRCWYSSSSILLNDGGKFYQRALQYMDKAKYLEEEKERERSKKMFDAWQKSQEASHDRKTQGVKVVKTLVKETQKARKEGKEEYAQEAMVLLEQAANEFNHPKALVQLGNIALQDASKKDSNPREMISKAMECFQKAGENGYRVGWYNFGHLLWTGYPAGLLEEENFPEVHTILAPDQHEAMEAFTKAIDLGDADAMYLVGVHRMTAGGRENIYSGLKLIEQAVGSGHGGAMYYWALLHLNGEPTIGLEPCTLEEFVQLLDRSVKAGHADAQFTRGHSYYHGTEGYPQNYRKALTDFLAAVEYGHADAAVSAGAMLHTGIGVSKDQREAFELYQTAGELGSLEGWKNVVACYTTGEGVPRSAETARYIAETMLKEK